MKTWEEFADYCRFKSNEYMSGAALVWQHKQNEIRGLQEQIQELKMECERLQQINREQSAIIQQGCPAVAMDDIHLDPALSHLLSKSHV